MIQVKNDSERAELYISGSIVDDEESNWLVGAEGYEWPRAIQRQLSECRGKKLTVYINSYGGSIAAGLAIANMIARHDKQTTAVVDGLCCSVATQIFFSANRCKCPSNAYLMVHKPTAAVDGTAEELRATAEVLNKMQSGLEETYRRKARDGVTAEQIHELVERETWLTGSEAASFFDIEVMPALKEINYVGRRERFKARHIPTGINFTDEQEARARIELSRARAKGALR